MRVVQVQWAYPVNILTMVCNLCDRRFRWPSRISLAECPQCGNLAYWHDFNGSEESPWPVATIALEEPDEQQK